MHSRFEHFANIDSHQAVAAEPRAVFLIVKKTTVSVTTWVLVVVETKKFLPCQPDNPTTQPTSQPDNPANQPTPPTQPASQPAMQRRQRGQHCVIRSKQDVSKGNSVRCAALCFGPPPRTIIFCNKSKVILLF